MSEPLLQVENLRIELRTGAPIVDDISFSLDEGQVLALVGESGSGKTTTGLALLGYSRPGASIVRGRVSVHGQELLGRTEDEVRSLRGRLVSYVPQDPSMSLNPGIRVGKLLAKILRQHFPDADPKREIPAVLERVRLPGDRSFKRRFPHQLSGGQQQRVTIALSLICQPRVVVMDEPTTGLDVVTQAQILEEVDRIKRDLGVAIVYVTHNLAVVAGLADRVAVMYAGSLVEEGPTADVLNRPRHPYTRGLVASIPDHAVPRLLRGIPGVAVGVSDRPPGCPFAPRCPQVTDACTTTTPQAEGVDRDHVVRCLDWRRTPPLAPEPPLSVNGRGRVETPLLAVETLCAHYRSPAGPVLAVNDVSFAIQSGECVALVGESGSGKTTIARCLAGLHTPSSGEILLDGTPVAGHARKRTREARQRIQIVFQNPYDSLNPRIRINEAIAYPARLLCGLSRRDADAEVARLLEQVRLPIRLARRYPRELSGGERQRAAIARALAAQPDVLICDEITSALDVSVQAAVIELLAELRSRLHLSLLFISHDLGVVASVSDRVLVLNGGTIREQGAVRAVLAEPADDYTRLLIAAAPRLH